MNRHLAAGLAIGGCLAFALAAGITRQPERAQDRQLSDADALVKNVEAYAHRTADAIETMKIMREAGRGTREESLAVQRAELESRILLARINDDQAAVTELLTDLVEHDAAHMDKAETHGGVRGELLEISERLARSSFRLWEHRKELAESK